MTAVTRWRHKQRALGLCWDCTQPAIPGRSRCEKHQAKHSENVCAQHHKDYANGLCQQCRKNPVTRFRKCPECRRKRA